MIKEQGIKMEWIISVFVVVMISTFLSSPAAAKYLG
jgi:hypothetical protein